MNEFFRFPHTPHIAWLGREGPRGDKVMSATEVEALLGGIVVVEEKLDGANLGFSVGEDGAIRAQNRGSYLQRPYAGQFAPLTSWLARHEDALFDVLEPGLVAFGEWCAARHSVRYKSLRDWWYLFDIFEIDRNQFWSVERRNAWALKADVVMIPAMFEGRATLDRLKVLTANSNSTAGNALAEGIVVRRDENGWLHSRGKLVRPAFIQAIDEHWRSRPIEWNQFLR